MRVLSSQPGRVVRLTGVYTDIDGGQNPEEVAMIGLDPEVNFDSCAGIVQGFGMTHGANFFLSNSIGGRIYLYTMADKPGDFELQVACFLKDCQSSRSGLSGIMGYYDLNRLSNRLEPVTVVLAPGSGEYYGFQSYLAGIQLNAQNPAFNLGMATLRFVQMPFELNSEPEAPETPTNMI